MMVSTRSRILVPIALLVGTALARSAWAGQCGTANPTPPFLVRSEACEYPTLSDWNRQVGEDVRDGASVPRTTWAVGGRIYDIRATRDQESWTWRFTGPAGEVVQLAWLKYWAAENRMALTIWPLPGEPTTTIWNDTGAFTYMNVPHAMSCKLLAAGLPYRIAFGHWSGVSGEAPESMGEVDFLAVEDPENPCALFPPPTSNGDPSNRPPEDPDSPREPQPTPPQPSAPCGATPNPVELTTGNVFIDQTDGEMATTMGVLRFTRSYNSANASSGGLFGPGWTHSFEKQLNFTSPGVIVLAEGDGSARHYRDDSGSGTYLPIAPAGSDDWITCEETTSPPYDCTRHFRVGGGERYWAGRLYTIYRNSPFGGYGAIDVRTGGTPTTPATIGVSPSSRLLTFNRTGNRITSLAGPEGTIASYTYDGGGRLASVTYADGSGYSYTYDGANRLLTVSDHSGRDLDRHSYDAAGRALTSEIGSGRERRTFSYEDNRTTVTDALGRVTRYDWQTIGGRRRIAEIDGPCSCGGETSLHRSWTYDPAGRILSATDGDGGTTSYGWSAAGALTSVTDPAGRTWSYGYDAGGQILSMTNPLGSTWSWEQGVHGPTSATDPLGNRRELVYDSHGQIVFATYRCPPGGCWGEWTNWYYSGDGDLTAMRVGQTTLDPGLLTTFGRDSMGRLSSVGDSLGNLTTIGRDARGRVAAVTYPGGARLAFGYDRGGRMLSASDELGRVTRYDYDPYGRLLRVTDPSGGATGFGYDVMSRLSSLTDARGRTSSFSYDDHGRLEGEQAPDGSWRRYTYDGAGRLATRTDERGVVKTATHDPAGRLIGESYSDGTLPVSYGYDAAGNLTVAANGVDVVTRSYDLAGRLTSEHSLLGASTVGYSYDAGGDRAAVRLDGAPFMSYEYDIAKRLTRLTHAGSSFSFGYDAASRRTSLGFPNGVTTRYGYDARRRLTDLTATVPVRGKLTTVTRWLYAYDAAGNRLSEDGDLKELYTYDLLDRLTTVKRGPISERYTYDAVGNRLSALWADLWTHGDRNQLLANNAMSFSYDAAGNQVRKVDGAVTWDYEYDAENRLRRVRRNGTEAARFAYDPFGRRVQKSAGGTTWTFVHDGMDLLVEKSSAGTTRRYLHGPQVDEPLAVEDDAGALTFLHADGLGSIVKTTDAAGHVTSTRKYDAFGNLQAGAASPGYAFTGREWDPEAGLYYYRARYYDPKLGRFLSPDPIGFGGGVNFYAYVGNRPTVFTDPFGLLAAPCAPSWETPGIYIGDLMISLEPPRYFIGPAPPDVIPNPWLNDEQLRDAAQECAAGNTSRCYVGRKAWQAVQMYLTGRFPGWLKQFRKWSSFF